MADFNTSLPRLPCAYQRGAIVYHRLNREPCRGMVGGIEFNLDGSVIYIITWEDDVTSTSRHCEYEITTVATYGSVEKDVEEKEED